MSRRVALLASIAVVVVSAIAGLTWWRVATEQACREVNVALGVITALAFAVRVNDMWTRFGFGGRVLRVGIFMLLVLAAGGSAEQLLDHVQLGYRSVALTVSLAVTLAGLIELHVDPEQP